MAARGLPLDPGVVARADAVDPEAGVAWPAETPSQQRVLDQMSHVDDQQRLAAERAGVEVVDDPAAQVALQLGIAQPQISQQHLACELVQGDAVPDRLGDSQLGQLVVLGIGIRVPQHRAEQLGGR